MILSFIFCRITVIIYVIYISLINTENHLQLYHLVTLNILNNKKYEICIILVEHIAKKCMHCRNRNNDHIMLGQVK